MNKAKKIVFIGGGSGLSNILEGVKKYRWDISAIVVMTDNGLSTGRIRRDFNTLPPGDVRKCLVALSNDKILKQVFEYRFQKGKGLAKHSLGNLILLALDKISGGYDKAIIKASEILSIKGKVIPSTLDNINLGGKLENGKEIIGERKLFLAGIKSKIKKVWLVPDNVKTNPKAIKEIKNADFIIIGPGSFYTSIIPNLLLSGIKNAILDNTKAQKIYICNVSTERGETQGYTVEDHINKLHEYSDKKIINSCLVNNKLISRSDKEYKLGEVKNITTTKADILGCKIIAGDFIDDFNPLYHDKYKIAKKLKKIIND